ncbi:MAG: hypothetical protein GYA17_00055, partial [Chloroflexi bacterium]|nr:hypothetical protein [Chloroflexota bacterium]
RKYGYFTLPVLHNGQLVGRLDSKAHRKEGIFEVKSLHLETGVEIDEALLCGLSGVIQACADWHRTPAVRLGLSQPPQLVEALARHLPPITT